MEKKMDRRTAYTRMVIQQSLLELLEKKHLSQVTVKEVCERAEINRSTFYRNYLDIFDVYEQMEEELVSSAFEKMEIEEGRYKMLELIYENRTFYKEFFASRLESRYIKGIIEKMYEEMKAYLIKNGTYDEKQFKILYRYNYYGAIGVIREWLLEDCPEEPREFGDILYGVVEKQYQ